MGGRFPINDQRDRSGNVFVSFVRLRRQPIPRLPRKGQTCSSERRVTSLNLVKDIWIALLRSDTLRVDDPWRPDRFHPEERRSGK